MSWRIRTTTRDTLPSAEAPPPRLSSDDRGTAAVEFGLIATPFLTMLFGIIGVGLYFLTSVSLDHFLQAELRSFRTNVVTSATAAEFRNKMCPKLPIHLSCENLQFNVKVMAAGDAFLPSCLDGSGNLKSSAEYVKPAPTDFVFAWICYEWTLTKIIPLVSLGNMSNGSMLAEASTAFWAEPPQ